MVVAFMAIPYFLQGLAESALVTSFIRAFGEECKENRVRRICVHAATFSVLGAFVTVLWALLMQYRNAPNTQTGILTLIATLLFGAMSATTIVLSIAYAAGWYARVARTLLSANIGVIVSLWMMRSAGSAGFLLSLLMGQVIVLAALWKPCHGVLGLQSTSSSKYIANCRIFSGDYVSGITNRFGTLVINAGSVVIAANLLNVKELAHFKLSLALVFGSLYAIPMNSQMVQAVASSRMPTMERQRSVGMSFVGQPFWLLFLAIAGFAMAGLVWMVVPIVQQFVLGYRPERLFRELAIAVPMIMVIQVLGPVLLAVRYDSAIKWSTALTVLAVPLGAVAFGPSFGVLCGATTLAISYFIASFYRLPTMEKRKGGVPESVEN